MPISFSISLALRNSVVEFFLESLLLLLCVAVVVVAVVVASAQTGISLDVQMTT